MALLRTVLFESNHYWTQDWEYARQQNYPALCFKNILFLGEYYVIFYAYKVYTATTWKRAAISERKRTDFSFKKLRNWSADRTECWEERGEGEWVKISVRLTKSKITFKKSIISYNKLEKCYVMSDFISYYSRA